MSTVHRKSGGTHGATHTGPAKPAHETHKPAQPPKPPAPPKPAPPPSGFSPPSTPGQIDLSGGAPSAPVNQGFGSADPIGGTPVVPAPSPQSLLVPTLSTAPNIAPVHGIQQTVRDNLTPWSLGLG